MTGTITKLFVNDRSLFITLLTVLIVILVLSGNAFAKSKELLPIPDKLVVLTFDDGNKSDYSFVAPLLKKYGFSATFFVTEGLGYRDNPEFYTSWQDVRQLHADGFEIGNHTRYHKSVRNQKKEDFLADLEYIEDRCREHGIPVPATFCYPGYVTGRGAVKILKEKGYLFARYGVNRAYDPAEDNPLLIPTTGASGPNWTLDDLVQAVEQARDGKIAVLTFHGVPAIEHPWVNTEPSAFVTYMKYLYDNDYKVIALRDLVKYVDPVKAYEAVKSRLGISPVELKCEYAFDPVGVGTAEPRFSWELESIRRDQKQSAYQILVASNVEKLEKNTGDLWDSGKVLSDKSVNVEFKGKALSSGQKCYWKVKNWDKDDTLSKWSEAAMFEIGLLKESDWQGQWIGADVSVSSPILRKEFKVTKKVERATVYTSGVGWSELYLNGQKVGWNVLDPAPTDYRRTILYVTYDVTDLLHEGSNAIGAMLGNGWFSEHAAPMIPPQYGPAPVLKLQLNIDFTDGTAASFKTDETWEVSPGPILRNDLWGGEVYDARLEKTGWKKANYDDSDWSPAQIKESPGGKMISQLMAAVRVNQIIEPISMTNPKPGVYVYDLGQLFGGWARVRLKGPKGTEVSITYSEAIYPDSGLVDKRYHDQFDRRRRLKYKREVDFYTLKGDPAGEVYEPRFTYHPVRYVQIEGNPGELTIDDLQGMVTHNAIDMSGDFECSNPLFNRIHKNVVWTFTNGLFGMPLDCMHREHWAWTDPATVAGGLYPRKYMPLFWIKWLRDIADAQLENGQIPDHSPNYPIGYDRCDPAWGGNYPILVWYVHQYYADNRLLEQHYPTLQKWMGYLESLSENYIVGKGLVRYGDHMLPGSAPGKEEFISKYTPPPLLWTGYYYRDACILSETAKILGKPDDAEYYADLAEKIKEALNKKWFDADTGIYADGAEWTRKGEKVPETSGLYPEGSQTANAFPLILGIVPDAYRAKILDNIIISVTQRYKGRLHTGNTGTTCMLDLLTEQGQGELLYRVINQKSYPGWGYMVEQGATTIWESWGFNSDKIDAESRSMIMWCVIDEYFYHDLAGIKGPDYHGPGYMTPGFKGIEIKPYIPEDLTYAGASIKTVRGIISSNWKKDAGSLTLEVTIPVNSTAKVSVPTMALKNIEVSESDAAVWKEGNFIKSSPGVTNATRTDDYITFNVGSGTYAFKLTGRN